MRLYSITVIRYINGLRTNNGNFDLDCIDNSNNVVIGEEEEEEEPISDIFEECFAANSTLQTIIEDGLEGIRLAFNGVFTTEGVREIGEGFVIGSETNTIEQLCAQIENAAETLDVSPGDIDEYI
ncbi:MAG: hypothetical protein AB7P56_06775 [Nitrososphaeraceae archaeon]